MDELVWTRTDPGPAFETPVREIIDLLVETGRALSRDDGGFLSEALAHMRIASPLDDGVLERCYADRSVFVTARRQAPGRARPAARL